MSKLTELFAQTVDLSPPEQTTVVERVRQTDPELARELEALLDESIVTNLKTATIKPGDTDEPLRLPTIPFAKLGIPGYRMHGELGKGGMGVVYDAEQIDPPRRVAIKVLHMAGPEALARFFSEIAIMQKLDHPSIAHVIEVGEANGHPFMVMERIDGVTLDVHVKTAAPKLAAKLELMARVCDAVHYAHDEGVIHRDLKPGNVMVRSDGTIAILDFGVARVGGSLRTQQGDFLGTLTYMSPEQATARIKEIDHRTDIYSLGVMVFEIVRGQLPYDLRGLHIAPAVRVIAGQAARPLGSPDRELDAVVAQALAKQKQQRQGSAAELARQLRSVASSL